MDWRLANQFLRCGVWLQSGAFHRGWTMHWLHWPTPGLAAAPVWIAPLDNLDGLYTVLCTYSRLRHHATPGWYGIPVRQWDTVGSKWIKAYQSCAQRRKDELGFRKLDDATMTFRYFSDCRSIAMVYYDAYVNWKWIEQNWTQILCKLNASRQQIRLFVQLPSMCGIEWSQRSKKDVTEKQGQGGTAHACRDWSSQGRFDVRNMCVLHHVDVYMFECNAEYDVYSL